LFGLCRSMWIIDLFITLPNPHLEATTHPSTPKVLWASERAPTPYLFIVITFWTHSWIHQRSWGYVKSCFTSLLNHFKYREKKITFAKKNEEYLCMPTKFSIVHTNLCGPMKTILVGRTCYRMTSIDEKSRMVWIYFKAKIKWIEKVKKFQVMAETSSTKKSKNLWMIAYKSLYQRLSMNITSWKVF
jgi:hypothetical protein